MPSASKKGEYTKLLEFIRDSDSLIFTGREIECLEVYCEAGSHKKAGKFLNIDPRNVSQNIIRAKRKAADLGYAPGHYEHGVAPGRTMGKVTIQRNADGEVERVWERQSPIENAARMICDVLETVTYKPAPPIPPPRKKLNEDLLSFYTITDYHLGMYAWADETGDDWDTEIASQVLIAAIQEMVRNTPNSKTAILNIQGDFLHWDGLDAVTPTSNHILDADTRFDRMIELSIDLTIWAVEYLLRHHQNVHVIVCEGNHDLAGSAWLRKTIKKMYSKNKRVTVDDTSFPFYAYLFGETMIGVHHGHKVKNQALPALFASEPRYRDMWGKATYTYIHTGHYHHEQLDEGAGAIVERHPTLAARDAYAARGGYVSRRGAKVIAYHKTKGEVHRSTIRPDGLD